MRKARLLILAFVVAAAVWHLASGPSETPPPPPQIVGDKGTMPGAFFKPRAIGIDAEGRFYVVDRSGRIQYFDSAGALLHVWSLPEHAKGQPVGLAVEESGNLLVNDRQEGVNSFKYRDLCSQASPYAAQLKTDNTGPDNTETLGNLSELQSALRVHNVRAIEWRRWNLDRT